MHGNVTTFLTITVENISLKPGIIYDFNIQNLITFEVNIIYKGDIHLIVYIDFETIAPTDSCLDS